MSDGLQHKRAGESLRRCAPMKSGGEMRLSPHAEKCEFGKENTHFNCARIPQFLHSGDGLRYTCHHCEKQLILRLLRMNPFSCPRLVLTR